MLTENGMSKTNILIRLSTATAAMVDWRRFGNPEKLNSILSTSYYIAIKPGPCWKSLKRKYVNSNLNPIEDFEISNTNKGKIISTYQPK